MVKKVLELCHFLNYQDVLNQTEMIETNFKAPSTPAEFYKLFDRKRNNAKSFDDCNYCHALDEEQSYLFWFDCLNTGMQLHQKYKNVIKKEELIEAMTTTENRKKSLKFRFERKYLPDQLQTEIGFLENELAKNKKESEIKISDLHNKIRIIEEKNRNYAFQATTTTDKQNQMEITIASLTQDLSNVNSQIESKIEENNNLKEQLSRVEEMNESKTVENNILKDTLEACETNLERTQERIRVLQENMSEMIERQNNVVDPGIQAIAANLDDIDLDDITVKNLECRICCEKNNDKVCLPCGHILCSSCCQETIRQRCQCPFCRTSVSNGEVYKIYDS